MTVARDDLRRDRLDGKPHGLGDVHFDARIDLREGADRAGNAQVAISLRAATSRPRARANSA
jgi:hypothetical protein